MIAIPIKERGEDPLIDERFGRAPLFCLIDGEGNWRFVENDALSSPSGAGVKAVQLLANEDVQTIISPEIGPKAMDIIEKLGMEVYHVGSSTHLKSVLVQFKENHLIQRETGPQAGGLRRA